MMGSMRATLVINEANLPLVFLLLFDGINENSTTIEVENIYAWKLSD